MKTLTFEQTFRPSLGVGNLTAEHPWDTFFHEARGDIPIAFAEPIEEAVDAQPEINETIDAEVTATEDREKGCSSECSNDERPSARDTGKGCFFLEGLVGGILAFSVAIIVFALELTGALVYCFAVGFYKLASNDSMPALFKAIFMLVVHIFLLVDSACLFCNVVVSEVLAIATGIIMMVLCSLQGDCMQAAFDWHQYIRKVSHLGRWAFRSFHHGWTPERQFPFDFGRSASSDDSTMVHVSASLVIDDEMDEDPQNAIPTGPVSASRAPEPPGEPSIEIPPVMSGVDDIIVVDVEQGSITASTTNDKK